MSCPVPGLSLALLPLPLERLENQRILLNKQPFVDSAITLSHWDLRSSPDTLIPGLGLVIIQPLSFSFPPPIPTFGYIEAMASEQAYGVTPPISVQLPTEAELRQSDALLEELKRQKTFESPAETAKR